MTSVRASALPRSANQPAQPCTLMPIGAADVVAVEFERQIGEGDEHEERGKEEQALQPAAMKDALGPVFESGGGAGGQKQPEEDDAPDGAGDVENVADAAEGDGFGQLVRGQRVGLCGGAC